MPVRIGFDMDGVLADFESAFREVELRLFGPGPGVSAGQPEKEEEEQPAADGEPSAGEGAPQPGAHELRRRRDLIWHAIRSTTDFWTTLKPTEDGAVRRIYDLTLRHRWEVFFITQRPATEGETVQRQTQKWLVQQGFDLPSVLVIRGSRGAATGALQLDYHVDDSPQNCLDVLSDSKARPILIVAGGDEITLANARKLGIGAAASIGECLSILEEAATVQTQPGMLRRFATYVGWK